MDQSIEILRKLTKKKRPKKLLQQEPTARKIFRDLILNEVKGIKALIELKKKVNKSVNLKDLEKFFGEGESIVEKIEMFVGKFMLGKKFDLANAELIQERILKSNLKKKTLIGLIYQKKAKKPEKRRKSDILNLYKQDPTMLVIEFNRNKNIKIEKQPSIENLMQGKQKATKTFN